MISDLKQSLINNETFPMHPILLAEGQFVYISVDEETKALIYVIISNDVMMEIQYHSVIFHHKSVNKNLNEPLWSTTPLFSILVH